MSKISEGCVKFEDEWESGRYEKAIDIYEEMGKPFWYAEKIGGYYERRGLVSKAMVEFELLIGAYEKMGILPLPRGPEELFKLGKWYNKQNPEKAKRYLMLYLRAEELENDPAFRIKHKKQAQNLLRGLDGI